MKKIMHLLSTNAFSGAENVACQVIKLFEKDKEYDMVYCSEIDSNCERLNSLGIKILKLDKFNYANVKRAIEYYQPDIIHSHDAKASVIAALACKGETIISHIHGNHENMRTFTFKTILYNIVSKKFNKIIWVSKSALDGYYYKDQIKNKSIVLYNVIDSEALLANISDDHKIYNFDLIYLGRLNYPKNPERLIEIIKGIKEKKNDIKVAIVGDGELKESIVELILKYNLQDNITVFGFMNNPYKVLECSKIMIMTSRYEGTPMCALEAIALGKPIVSTPTDGLKELVENGVNGFLYESDYEISNKVIEILNSNKLLSDLERNTEKLNKSINDKDKYKKVMNRIYRGNLNE